MDENCELWLNEWYCKCRNKFIDLCNFGGNELFVIEGDSLLFKFLYDPETNIIDFSQSYAGGQFLALTFLVENFLKKLKECDLDFHIVFFNVHQSIWNNRPKLRLAREIIIDHLKSHDTKVPVYEFENWWIEEWKEYLDNKQPLFILTGDGSTECLEVKDGKNYSEDDESPVLGIATKNSLSLTIVLRAFIFSSLHKDISVALFPGMEFKNSRVCSFIFERGGNVNLETIKKIVDVENLSIKACGLYDEKSEWLKSPVNDFELTTPIKDLLTSDECLNVWSSGGKRIALILLSLTGVLCNNADKSDFQYLARIFLLHTILQDYLPLKSRVVPPVDDENTKAKRRIDLFFQNFYSHCAKIYTSGIFFEATKNFKDLNNNLYDLLDARLFISLTQCRCDDVLNFNVLPTEIKQQFDACWNLLKQLCECNEINSLNVENDERFGKRFLVKSYQKNYLENNKNPNLLPFKHEFFEECLGNMKLNLREDPNIEIDEGDYGLIGNVYYNESTYNYTLKLKKDINERYKRKGYQTFVRFLEKYAASLHGTQGYYRQKIVVDKSIKKESSKPSSKSASKSVKNEATGTKKAREKIEKENLKKSLGESDQYLDDALKEISKDGNIRNQINSLNLKLEKTEKIKHPFTKFRGQFRKLELLVKLWTEHCMNSKEKDWEIPVEILHQVFYIAQNFQKLLDSTRKEILLNVLSRLKLNDCRSRLKKMLKSEKSEKSEKPPAFKFDLPSEWADLSVGMSDARFQMLYAGHLMDRNTNSKDDDRVPFKPDAWQVRVLDIIDDNESALICCPTSSGKTFISFYAMEKVLREDDDGILVYVSPTKALVNQVTAEVYGRFEKQYDHGDKSTWGIYTREYCENQDKCQILVTIPQMLESLLFSPERVSWARNIKRIIFDEVHMIGSEDGEFYDRLLLLSKSIPILALSATVGNPEEFNKWIARSKEIRGHKMELILTTKRFSDLQPYVYLPKFPLPSLLKTTVNSKEKQQNNSIVSINPIFSLPIGILKEYGFPADMKLVPSQCVQFWDVMKKHVGENSPDGFDELDPDLYFKDIGYIVKDDADEYERRLKEIFVNYAKDDSLNKLVESTIEELGADIKNGFAILESTAKELANNELGEDGVNKSEVGKGEEVKNEDGSSDEVEEGLDDGLGNGELVDKLDNNKLDNKLVKELDVYGNEFLKEGIVPLLCELSAQDKLPAILFHFDEKGCIELASHILKQLESAEEEKRAKDPKYKAKKKAAMLRKEAYEKDFKRKRDKKVNTQDGEPELDEGPNFFDWEAHDPDFTFVNPKARVTSEDFGEIVGPARYKMSGNYKILITALERGIGVHHTDLPRKYLSAVEILFRRRYLRVIIATGTLALGINMPCKTTVFVGDSISLTALQYRQMSGRSGRRGFDPLGHVVFFGITLTKIIRLLMSGLPDLSRHFPLTTTQTLRSFNLLNQCKNNNDDYNFAKSVIKGLFGESFFFLGKEYLPERIKYYLRFSVEYLTRENLVDRGNLINLSALATHLNYNEPSNFAFAVLYKHGVFHRICSRSRTNEEIMNDLVLILSRLFNRIKLRKIPGDWYQNYVKKSKIPSKIILPPLPEDIDDIIEQHNQRVLDLYTDYVLTFARNNASNLRLDNILPLSSIEIPPKSIGQNLLKKDPLLSKLESMAISFIARSPFIAMCSSLGDIFNDLEDLTSHVRSGIYLDPCSIPFIKTNETLNAYISDFFSHGQEEAIVESNGIRPGEVWKVLNDFFSVLSSIIISLRKKNFAMIENNLDDNDILRGFEMVLEHFSEKFIQIWA